MKEIFLLDKGWKFKKESEIIQKKVNDYFDSFSDNTKTGLSNDVKGEFFYDEDWETVNLPHDWLEYEEFNPQGRGNMAYKKTGRVWYRKHFTLPCKNKRAFLKIDAISNYSEIYVNSVKVSRLDSGSTEIFTEITDFIEENKQICISVLAENNIKEGWWYEGGGIFSHTYLILSENSKIENHGIFACPKKNGEKWDLDISCDLDLDSEEYKLLCEIDELNLCQNKKAEKHIHFHFNDIMPVEWNIDNPKLYDLKVSLVRDNEAIDEETVKIGFRDCKFDCKNGFSINGQNIKLKGVCMHNDHAGVGVALPKGVMEYRLGLLKEMGCNAIRTSHNPYLPEFYDLCDRMGFLVMNEVRHFSSSEECLSHLESFVKRDRNHPSVILWSIFNEEPLQCTKAGEKISRKMISLIKSLDNSRPITGGMNGPLEQEGVVNTVDVMGFNYTQYGYDTFHSMHPNLPILGSETGSYMSTRGDYVTDKEKRKISSYGREYFENLYAWSATPGETWKNIIERDFVMGGFYWTAFDYRGECGKYPANVSTFGAMDLCGFKKDNYFWHKILWNDEPDIYISQNWQDNQGIMCYSNCDELEFYVNNRLIKRVLNNKFDPKLQKIDFEPGELKVIGYCKGGKVTEKSVFSHGIIHKLKREVFSYEDCVIINYYAYDENGNFVNNAYDKVVFELTGAELLGVGNGNNSSLESDKIPERNLYNGCVQLIIKPTEKSFTVTTKSEDICDVYNGKATIENTKEILSEEQKMPINQWRMTDLLENYPDKDKIGDLMFAWIPTTVGYGENLMFSNKAGYGMIAGSINLPETAENLSVTFEKIIGDFDIYFNDILIGSYTDSDNLSINIPQKFNGVNIVISVIFKLKKAKTGIVGNVYLKQIKK